MRWDTWWLIRLYSPPSGSLGIPIAGNADVGVFGYHDTNVHGMSGGRPRKALRTNGEVTRASAPSLARCTYPAITAVASAATAASCLGILRTSCHGERLDLSDAITSGEPK